MASGEDVWSGGVAWGGEAFCSGSRGLEVWFDYYTQTLFLVREGKKRREGGREGGKERGRKRKEKGRTEGKE